VLPSVSASVAKELLRDNNWLVAATIISIIDSSSMTV
jgi:hypothetical protein